jgi:hypothetical protein
MSPLISFLAASTLPALLEHEELIDLTSSSVVCDGF